MSNFGCTTCIPGAGLSTFKVTTYVRPATVSKPPKPSLIVSEYPDAPQPLSQFSGRTPSTLQSMVGLSGPGVLGLSGSCQPPTKAFNCSNGRVRCSSTTTLYGSSTCEVKRS